MTSQTSIPQLAPPPAFRRVTNVNSPFYKGEINSNKSNANDEDDDINELGENSYLSLPECHVSQGSTHRMMRVDARLFFHGRINTTGLWIPDVSFDPLLQHMS